MEKSLPLDDQSLRCAFESLGILMVFLVQYHSRCHAKVVHPHLGNYGHPLDFFLIAATVPVDKACLHGIASDLLTGKLK
jgi:hypothetical protein